MKQLGITIAAAVALTVAAEAQNVNVNVGHVTTVFSTPITEMPYTESGAQLTISGVTYPTASIDSIIIDDTTVDDNTVAVTYNGTEAWVTIAGNIAPYVTATVNGAHVAIAQSDDLPKEVTYTLAGTSSDGSFYMSGSLKATLVLNGLTLTCADSAAINIQNGKRIAVELPEGTVNSLADGASGSQKGCFMVKGHTEFKGAGSLTIAGNAKHAFWGGEYVEVKKTVGSITVTSAKKDGFNIEQYYEQKGGVVTISGTGDDGIQVSASDDATDEQNGQAIISGGTLSIAITATAAKGLKCDSLLTISGGTIGITTSGGAEYDSDDNDVSGSAAIKGGANVDITGGTITLKSTGAGGKGISADGDITISGGTISVTTTGKQYVYGSLDTSPKGIKADGNLTISGGTITVTTSGGEGSEGIESKNIMTITDGEIVVNAYDDALNATNQINISGGKVFALSTGNDGIDSNGSITVSGGLVIACGSRSPEGSFDCDQNTFTVTGGTLIGLGGDASKPTASTTTQPVVLIGRQTFTKGSYIAVAKSGASTPIFAFCVPQAYTQQAQLFVSDPEFAIGSTYVVTKNVTVSGGTSWQGYTTDATVSGGSTVSTITISSVVTSSGGSGGPGGGPGGGGW